MTVGPANKELEATVTTVSAPDVPSGATVRPPPQWVENASCYSPVLLDDPDSLLVTAATPVTAFKAALVLATLVVSLTFNVVFIAVLNSHKFRRRRIRLQPRLILLSLSGANLLMEVSVTLFAIYPTLFNCWPYGKWTCQLQAFFRGVLYHQSSATLVLLALERYVVTIRPMEYSNIMSVKKCVTYICLTWASSVCLYGLIVDVSGYHFNVNGLMVCEAYFYSNVALVLSADLFYFPTTMILMYCYGTVFHSNTARMRYKQVGGVLSTTVTCVASHRLRPPPPLGLQDNQLNIATSKMVEERMACESTSRSCAAISLAFIAIVTPWAIQKVITSCTETMAPPLVDFMVCWLASTHRFIVPLIFFHLNKHFRRQTIRLVLQKVCRGYCSYPGVARDGVDRHLGVGSVVGGSDYEGEVKGVSSLAMALVTFDVTSNNEVSASEKRSAIFKLENHAREQHWGEILDKSFSSQSLNNSNGYPPQNSP